MVIANANNDVRVDSALNDTYVRIVAGQRFRTGSTVWIRIGAV